MYHRLLNIQKNHKLITSQFVRYCVIGFVNTLLDFGLYTSLTRGIIFFRQHYLAANALSFIVVVTWSFFWNKYWTFQEQSTRHGVQYVRFFLITLGGIGIAQSTLFLGVELFGIPDLVAKIFAGPLVLVWNFSMHRLWTFSFKDHKEITEILP